MKKYEVVMHKFLGYDPDGSATYEIKFNQSLEHTGRFSGIEDGLNNYVRKEIRKEAAGSFSNLFRSIGRLFASESRQLLKK